MAVEFLDLIPVVPYVDIRGGHDFLVDVLGFSSGGIVESPDGTVVHLTLPVDGSTPLAEAHAQASRVEERIRREQPEIDEVIVHTEP